MAVADKNNPEQSSFSRVLKALKTLSENADKPYVLRSLSVEGFKSIFNRKDLRLTPLTLLAGSNSSGKSSMLQPLLLLKQTFEAQYDPGPLLLNGPNVKFSDPEQFVAAARHRSQESIVRFGLLFESDASPVHISGFCNEFVVNHGQLELESTNWLFPGGRKIELHHDDKIDYSDYLGLSAHTLPALGGPDIEPERVVRQRGLLMVPWIIETQRIAKTLRQMIHVPGLRGEPSRTYPATAVDNSFSGTFLPYTASVIQSWQETKDQRLAQLGKQLEQLGLTWKADVKRIDATQLELRVGRLPMARRGGAKDLVSVADVGFGVSQVLPVLVALLVAEPGSLVYLEQPELHLHPRAQVELAPIVAAAAERDVRVVVETHSAFLLLALQALVAEGKLPSELVNLHWFQRDEDGATEISSTSLDDMGAYGDWPVDFGDVEAQLENRYLDAVEERLKAQGKL